jgi:adenine phosphoribosyltransferase
MSEQRYHRVQIAGLTRDLPICEIGPGVNIALLNLLGDTELVEAAAGELARRVPEADVVMAPAEKAISLAHALSVRLGIPYVIARKRIKPYMINVLTATVIPITDKKPQTLCIDGRDAEKLANKRVLLLDDVTTDGATMKGLRHLAEQAQATVAGEAVVFTEDGPPWDNIIALGDLPIFMSESRP